MCTVQMPAVMARQREPDTEVTGFDLVGTGTVARSPVDRAIGVRRTDGQMVIGHEPRQIRIARRQFENDRVVAVLDDISDVGQQSLGRGGRAVAAVVVHRCNDVVGCHLATRVEGDVFVELESPLRCVRIRRPFGGDIRPKRPIWFDQGKVTAVSMRQHDHGDGEIGARIVGV